MGLSGHRRVRHVASACWAFGVLTLTLLAACSSDTDASSDASGTTVLATSPDAPAETGIAAASTAVAAASTAVAAASTAVAAASTAVAAASSAATSAAPPPAPAGERDVAAAAVSSFAVPAGSRPHDVWAMADGSVWYTAQARAALGRLDPASGEVREVPLGPGSRPHGVIAGPDGMLWVTDGGLNAIVRVDPATLAVTPFPLPDSHADANLNTATFDSAGRLWFTGQNGVYGRLDAASGEMEVFDAPLGRGPYGITAAAGAIWYASLAGHHLARVDTDSGDATVIRPPTERQGTRRAWADSRGRIWTSQWDAGQVAVYDADADADAWREWRLPGAGPQAYAVYVDEQDDVWLSDFGANALVHFDPDREAFTSFALPHSPGNVRQIHGRAGEVWGAESAADQLVVVRIPLT